MALVASNAPAAQEAEALLRARYPFVPLEQASLVVALGGDGFLLQTLHDMLGGDCMKPIFGMNRGTVGFLMNEFSADGLERRLAEAKAFSVAPLEMEARTVSGDTLSSAAINDVSLLRETRQTAWI